MVLAQKGAGLSRFRRELFLFADGRSSGNAGMVAPVVLGVELGAIVPGFPFLFGKFVQHLPLVIEDVGVFTKNEIKNGLQDAHERNLTGGRGGVKSRARVGADVDNIEAFVFRNLGLIALKVAEASVRRLFKSIFIGVRRLANFEALAAVLEFERIGFLGCVFADPCEGAA